MQNEVYKYRCTNPLILLKGLWLISSTDTDGNLDGNGSLGSFVMRGDVMIGARRYYKRFVFIQCPIHILDTALL